MEKQEKITSDFFKRKLGRKIVQSEPRKEDAIKHKPSKRKGTRVSAAGLGSLKKLGKMVAVALEENMLYLSPPFQNHNISGQENRWVPPMSPYLFMLVMEIFSGILNARTSCREFKFYWRCKPAKLSHLFFANDVFLFSQANWPSVSMLKRSLDIFSSRSGLFPNKSKSEVFLSGSSPSLRRNILWAFGFQKGHLPVRYLGVLIISSRLGKANCIILERLQLIRSVLHSIQAYWASVFTLPVSVLEIIEQILRQFLWKGSSLTRGGAKVSWDDVCQPKVEGGLGIRKLRDCNRATINFLKRDNFWVAPKPTVCSWGWKKILQLRREFQPLFRWKVGNGVSISVWFDWWNPLGHLNLFLPESIIERFGLSRHASVAEFLSPAGQVARILLQEWHLALPILSSSPDQFYWHGNSSGIFAIGSVWEIIRTKK
ncbi:uncharacterized protein [Rutidosis leptorrhynchoides]|uniref:uncharacterized protein n=1 Tax=Rutidosis leptorrhynchoides TaxID=125765 RepID=UPI003A9976C1